MKDKDEFVVDVLGIAAFCSARGLRLTRTEPVPSKRGILAFVFADPEHRGAALVGEFFTNGSICARDFDREITRVKGLIWDFVHPSTKRQVFGRDVEPLQPRYFPESGK